MCELTGLTKRLRQEQGQGCGESSGCLRSVHGQPRMPGARPCQQARLTIDVKVSGEVRLPVIGSSNVSMQIAQENRSHAQEDQFAKSRVLGRLTERMRDGLEPGPHSLHEKQILLLGKLEESAKLRGVHSHRFFTEYMLPSIQGVARILVVVSMWRA